ncbi:MAG: hypothetical protein NZ528_11430 [Caldilineales bacterium]|nr:hypothetical protein [Caldilineales bacterium]MDW8317697.1 hypothetical protein [Anaerolineae bacterium]
MRMSLRGVGVPIVTAYLVDLGGAALEAGLVVGDGWQARVWAGEPVQLAALRIGVTEVEISGEPGAVAQTAAELERKTIRGGG